jgi:transposase
VLIDHTNQRILEVLETREKPALKAWLKEGRASGLLAELEEVTTDMWDGFTMAVREALGGRVRLVIDRFHVMKLFQEQLNRARCEIQRKLPREAASELKGSRWLWTSNAENLTSEQRQELERLKHRFPELASLAKHRDELRCIFEDRRIKTAAVATLHFRKWCRRGRLLGCKALEPFYKTLENWMSKIANYFVSRSSNGRTEGFNRNLRTLLWRACGMTNFQHFRLRVLHALG